MGKRKSRLKSWRTLKRLQAKRLKKNLQNYKNRIKEKTTPCDDFQEGLNNYKHEATNAFIDHHCSNLDYPGPEITTSNISVSINQKAEKPETTINVLQPTPHIKDLHQEEISVTDDEKEDRPETNINVLPIRHLKDLHTKKNFVTENEKTERPKITIIVLPTLNLKDSPEGESLVMKKVNGPEIDRTKQEAPLSRMRLLVENNAKGDKFALFGENIAHKFRRSMKHVSEINIAKQLIDNVLQKLHNSSSQIV